MNKKNSTIKYQKALPIHVTFFHRKPRLNVNFSVENLFASLRQAMPAEVHCVVKELKYHSTGLWKRLYICLEAFFCQEGVNHITGDIHFIALFLRKRKTLLTILDVGFMEHPNRAARWLLKYLWLVLPVKRVAVVTTISEATRRQLLTYVTIDPARVKVIYIPIGGQFIPIPRVFNSEEPTILQVGTKSNKNVIRLVQALKGIRCRMEIIGELSTELRHALSDNNINYHSSKNLTNEEVLKKYIECDIMAFVSTYEGFGMPIVEANAVGRVVVTSNLLSMPEVAGDAAHLCDPYSVESIRDGIRRVIEEQVYRELLIARGYENRKRFDAKRIAMEYTAIYQSLSH